MPYLQAVVVLFQEGPLAYQHTDHVQKDITLQFRLMNIYDAEPD